MLHTLLYAGVALFFVIQSVTANNLPTSAADDDDDESETAAVLGNHLDVTDTLSGPGASDSLPIMMTSDMDMASQGQSLMPARTADVNLPSGGDGVALTGPDLNHAASNSSTNSLISSPFGSGSSDPDHELRHRDVIIIAISVGFLSIVIIVLSIIMTFVMRKRMRRKAYLRVKHASQTELSVHYVQNSGTVAAAVRDAAMEKLFESLAAMNPGGQDDLQNGYSSDDQCLSPTESISEFNGGPGKSRVCSRSMPSLKNLNAHEEALNCTFVSNIVQQPTGRMKGRSRSFTEKMVSGVVANGPLHKAEAFRGRSRSQSEKRSAIVSLFVPGRRFEKKSEKSSRRSKPSFSHFSRFNPLKGLVARKSSSVEVQVSLSASTDTPTRVIDSPDLSCQECCSASLSDFELPTVSPILHEFDPMLKTFQSTDQPERGQSLTEIDISGMTGGDIRVFHDAPSLESGFDRATENKNRTDKYEIGRKSSRISPQDNKKYSEINWINGSSQCGHSGVSKGQRTAAGQSEASKRSATLDQRTISGPTFLEISCSSPSGQKIASGQSATMGQRVTSGQSRSVNDLKDYH